MQGWLLETYGSWMPLCAVVALFDFAAMATVLLGFDTRCLDPESKTK